MKQVLLLLFLSLFFVNDSQGQYITQEKAFLSTKYIQNGIQLSSKKQLLSAIESNPQAYDQIKSAYGLRSTSKIISAIGGLTFGLGIGLAKTNTEAGGKAMLSGLGLMILALPISIVGESKIKKAINFYNEDHPLRDTGMNSSPTLNLQTNSNGVGLVLAF